MPLNTEIPNQLNKMNLLEKKFNYFIFKEQLRELCFCRVFSQLIPLILRVVILFLIFPFIMYNVYVNLNEFLCYIIMILLIISCPYTVSFFVIFNPVISRISTKRALIILYPYKEILQLSEDTPVAIKELLSYYHKYQTDPPKTMITFKKITKDVVVSVSIIRKYIKDQKINIESSLFNKIRN